MQTVHVLTAKLNNFTFAFLSFLAVCGSCWEAHVDIIFREPANKQQRERMSFQVTGGFWSFRFLSYTLSTFSDVHPIRVCVKYAFWLRIEASIRFLQHNTATKRQYFNRWMCIWKAWRAVVVVVRRRRWEWCHCYPELVVDVRCSKSPHQKCTIAVKCVW